ncbi:MAG: 2-oxoacid:ferredoxin oxidoreductase subunit beta [Candidatus Dadabacteria bacterium]|nr:MAG: 2-oxoacid:ferredoxin oxidoreductase subunit beta [Candidatus Dadabacteria bacterium]
MADAAVKLTKKDFESDQDVRWCPGCGDYAILSAVQKALPELGIPRERHVFIAGIGCSSRFPYYMNTYGFHTIHGRAPTIATGVKVANPELCVWVISGDGDGLSIGGNHMLHVLRRNVDLNIILFNNEIYGLTKGQYSPTSKVGTVTKSSPFGSQDYPVNPLAFALGAGATWYGRTIDRDIKHMTGMVQKAPQHHGTSLLEVLQNCIVFNDGVYGDLYDAKTKKDHILYLEDGQPMIFGTEDQYALVLENYGLKVVDRDQVDDSDIVVHDVRNRELAFLLSELERPVPVGVIYDRERAVYEDQVHELEQQVIEANAPGDLAAVLRSGTTWTVS